MRVCHVALASLVIIIVWAGLRVMAILLFQLSKSIEVVVEVLLQAVNLGSKFMMGGFVSLWLYSSDPPFPLQYLTVWATAILHPTSASTSFFRQDSLPWVFTPLRLGTGERTMVFIFFFSVSNLNGQETLRGAARAFSLRVWPGLDLRGEYKKGLIKINASKRPLYQQCGMKEKLKS